MFYTPEDDNTCPACLCVPTTDAARCLAVQELVKPHEVARYVAHVPRQWLVSHVGQILARMSYIPDPDSCDRWCAPSVTIKRGGGDCDDLAILGVSLLLAGGADAYVVTGHHYDADGHRDGHAWIEGSIAGEPFTIEATNGEVFWDQFRRDEYVADLIMRPGVCQRAA
jgi:transglutaminase-like putative cysteine protease